MNLISRIIKASSEDLELAFGLVINGSAIKHHYGIQA